MTISKCAAVNCQDPHATCEDLAEGQKGYDAWGNENQGDGYSCKEACHEVMLSSITLQVLDVQFSLK